MSTAPPFSTQLLGQTEKTLNVILDRQLAGTGLDERQWITLTLIVMSGGSVDRDQIVSRVADGVKVSKTEAQEPLAELEAAHLVQAHDGEASVKITDAGQQLHSRIRTAVTEITERMWGDLPADDLAAAGRVLGTVLERANAELARS